MRAMASPGWAGDTGHVRPIVGGQARRDGAGWNL